MDGEAALLDGLAQELAHETGIPVRECMEMLVAEKGQRTVVGSGTEDSCIAEASDDGSIEGHEPKVTFRLHFPTEIRPYELSEVELEEKREAHRMGKLVSREILAERSSKAEQFLPAARKLQAAGQLAEALALFYEAIDVPGACWGRPKLRRKIEALERRVAGSSPCHGGVADLDTARTTVPAPKPEDEVIR